MSGKIESFSRKISWIRTSSQISRKFSYWESLLLFWMMLKKASTNLYTLGNNIYTRKNSLTNIYLYKVNNSNTRKWCEIYSELTIKTQERRSTVFIVNFKTYFTTFSSVSIVDFKQVNVCWAPPYQFKNVEINYCCNYWQMHKNLCEMAAHKKGLWSDVVVPKKHFFCILLCWIVRNNFFQSTLFLYVTKVVAAIHFLMDTIFILEERFQSWLPTD